MQEHTIEGIERDQRLLINRSMRVQPDWPDIEIAWENLRLALREIAAALAQMPGIAERAGRGRDGELRARPRGSGLAASRRRRGRSSGMSAALEKDDPQRIVWLEASVPMGASSSRRCRWRWTACCRSACTRVWTRWC